MRYLVGPGRNVHLTIAASTTGGGTAVVAVCVCELVTKAVRATTSATV